MATSLIRRALSAIGERLVLSPGVDLKSIDTSTIGGLAPSESKSLAPLDTKASSLSLLPRGAYGPNYVFFSPDGGRSFINLSDDPTSIAFVAYWYVATRWRAQKIAEAPLMVVVEDQQDGSEKWLPDHDLVSILDEPSPDYDMGELLETTSHYLDNTGAALWVLDQDRVGRTGRITPFSRTEFETLDDGSRLYAAFRVRTKLGQRDFSADKVCFFRDAHGTAAWGRGRSRLDVAMSWLRLSAKAQQTVYDLLSNSVWPSAVMIPDKDWNPDQETLNAYKQDLENYARGGNKGRPFVMLGGGTFEPLAASIKDLVPDEVLSRVESIVAAISGVPAVVLQFQIGMENSPWSNLPTARRMAYDDTIVPTWRKWERVLTRQLLRPIDEDVTHFIRFDRSQIDSLQRDQAEAVSIAVQMGRAATVNERRTQMGLEPATKKQDPDGKADEIPELSAPSFADIALGLAGGANGNGKPPADDATKDPAADPADEATKMLAGIARKFKAPALQQAFREEAIPVWQVHAAQRLKSDADQIAEIVASLLDDAVHKSIETKDRAKGKVMDAVGRYLKDESKRAWTKALGPLATQAASRSGAVIAAELNVSYNLLHPHLLTFAARETGKMITQVSDTTKSLVSDIIQGGLDEGASSSAIANLVRDASGFSKERATLIARTEVATAFNGGPTESLAAFGNATGRKFMKTWSTSLDDRVREEPDDNHVAMEGETVPVDEPFSNGSMYPDSPNERCTVLFSEVEE